MSKRKSVQHVVDRIVRMGHLDNEQEYVVRHMIESLLRNRDVLIDKLSIRAEQNEREITPKQISGALKCCIDSHGPITRAFTGSAAKRVHKVVIAPTDDRAPPVRVEEVYQEAGFSPCDGLTEYPDPPVNIHGYWHDERWKKVHEYRKMGDAHGHAIALAAEIRQDWGVL